MKLKVSEEAIPITRQAGFPHQAAGRDASDRSGKGAPGLPEVGMPAVTVLTSAVLQAARMQRRESLDDLAAPVGITSGAVVAAADGTQPAWSMPYPEFASLAGSVAAGDPELRQLFETAVACDLLLTCVLVGDQAFATDVLTDEDTRDAARWLLGLVVSGKPGTHLRLPLKLSALSDEQVAALGDRTAALAMSGSPDAWVGAELESLAAGVAGDR